jgi:hypothetical protein
MIATATTATTIIDPTVTIVKSVSIVRLAGDDDSSASKSPKALGSGEALSGPDGCSGSVSSGLAGSGFVDSGSLDSGLVGSGSISVVSVSFMVK